MQYIGGTWLMILAIATFYFALENGQQVKNFHFVFILLSFYLTGQFCISALLEWIHYECYWKKQALQTIWHLKMQTNFGKCISVKRFKNIAWTLFGVTYLLVCVGIWLRVHGKLINVEALVSVLCRDTESVLWYLMWRWREGKQWSDETAYSVTVWEHYLVRGNGKV